MGLFEKLKGELIDIIEWLDQSNDTIAYRFERFQNEIKMGAQLIVRPGQKAVFVNQGQVADAFEPGQYELVTKNLPILSTLQGWKYGFNSPFKAEVYFFNTRVFTDLKWGTSNPITIRDPELGILRLRAYGTYTFRVSDPVRMLEQIISTDGLFQLDEIQDQIRNMILTGFATWVGRADTSFLDFAARYQEFGDSIRQSIQADIQTFGLELQRIYVENISVPPEVEQAIDRRNAMGILGNMQQYAQYQAANAIEASAKNPAGGSNPGLDFGVGLAMGQQFINAMQQNQSVSQNQAAPAQPAAPPPPPPAVQWHISRNGQNFGPFAPEQLAQQGLTPDTYVWRNGMSGWQQLSQVPELAFLLSSPPPPPPAAG